MHDQRKARLLIFAAAVLFSTGGAAIKATSLGSWQVACLRAGIASIVILAAFPDARRWPDRRIALVAVAYAIMGVSFAVANKLTTAANAIFLQDTAPVYLMLAGPLWLGERVRPRDIAFLAVMAAGGAMFFAGEPARYATAPDPVKGNLIAVISALAWAASIGGLRWITRGGAGELGLTTVAAGNAIACVSTLPLAWPIPAVTAADAAVLLYLGAIQIGLGYAIFTRGVRHATAIEASLIMMAEPAFSPLWAYLVHGEMPTAWAAAGGVLILAATALRVLCR